MEDWFVGFELVDGESHKTDVATNLLEVGEGNVVWRRKKRGMERS